MQSPTKFQVGDRVERFVDTWAPSLGFKRGTVTRVYSTDQYTLGNLVLGPYPELYEVQFDDGTTGPAFLPHGLFALKGESNDAISS